MQPGDFAAAFAVPHAGAAVFVASEEEPARQRGEAVHLAGGEADGFGEIAGAHAGFPRIEKVKAALGGDGDALAVFRSVDAPAVFRSVDESEADRGKRRDAMPLPRFALRRSAQRAVAARQFEV